MLAFGLTRPDCSVLAIGRQTENAVRVEAGEIGLDHLLGGDCCVGVGNAAGFERLAA